LNIINTVDYDISVVKQFLLKQKEFNGKVLKNLDEIQDLIKKIIIDSKIPWNDIHRGQFGRNKNGDLIALDLGVKQKNRNDSHLFNKNVSKLSLRGKKIKLISESYNYKIVNFWDFDKTLFDTDEKNVGIKKWENFYNKKYPHVGWFSKKESLDPNLDIRPLQYVIDNHKDLFANSTNILLSNRMQKLQAEISQILELNNIFVDGFLLHNGKNKTERILDFLEENPDINEINIFDDKRSILLLHKEFKDLYAVWREDLKINIFDTSSGFPVLFDVISN
jgi:hypothetical protein